MDVISERLTKLRDEKGATQEEVAEACDMSRVTLARYENGTRKPIPKNLSRLAEYYGKTADYLLGREENPLMKSYEETFSRPLMLDGQPPKGWLEDRPETQMVAAEVMAKALSCGATKEEVVDFNNLFFQLLPEERRIFISSMKALNLQRDKEEKT